MGSCYHSQVQYADKPMMTAKLRQGVCARGYALSALESTYARALPQPEDRNLSMAAEIVSIPEIPSVSKQPATGQESEANGRERERLSAKSVHSATSTGAIFHKIKAPLFRGASCFTAMAYPVGH